MSTCTAVLGQLVTKLNAKQNGHDAVTLTEASTTVYFAGMFPSWPNKARVPGFVLDAGTRLALDHINNDSSILSGYTLDMVTGDSKCDPKVAFNSLVKLLANPPNILALYGAACSDATQTLAEMTAFANVAQVSHTSTSLSLSTANEFPSLYRVIPTDFPAIQASIALVKMFKWSRVAIIGEKTASGLLESAYEVVVRDMVRNGVDVEWSRIINTDDVEKSIIEIKKKDIRIIIAAVSATFGKKLMSQAYVSGLYSPEYVWIWLETYPATWWHDTNTTQNETVKTVVQYSFSFGDNINIQDRTTNTISGRTPNEVWTEYLQRLGMSFVPPLAAYSYDGAWFLAKALDNVVRSHGIKLEDITTGNETFYELLISSLSSVTFTGITGSIQVYSKDYRERLDGPAHIFQYDQDGNAIEVMMYDVFNNVTTKVGKGHLWTNDQAIPKDRKPTTIYFAGMFPSLPNKARVPGFVLDAGTRLALDHINNDSSILSGYTLDIVTGDSKCDPKVAFNSLVKLLANPPNILALYGAACSDATQTLAGMTAFANVAQVSHTSTSLSLSNANEFPSLYRVIPTDFPAIQASIALVKMFNWSRVAIIGEKTATGLLESAYEVVVRDMARNEIDVEWNKVINAEQIEQSITEIKKKNIRIVITAVSSDFGKKLMSQAYVSRLYSPEYVWIWLETYPATWWHDTNTTQNETMKTVVQYSFSFGDNINIQDRTTNTISGRTPNEVWTEYLQRLGMSFVPPLAAYSYDGAWFLAKALDNVVRNHGIKLEDITTGNETFYELLISSLSSVTFTGITGSIQVYSKDYRERLDGPAHIFQYDQDGNAIEVMMYDVINNVTTLKFGHGHLWKGNDTIPSDREPGITIIYEAQEMKEWIFILLTALCVLSIFFSFVFISSQCWRNFGKHAASLNIVIATGSICLCISGILYGLRVMDKLDDYDETKKTCLGQLGLTSVGLSLLLGAIISKLLLIRCKDVSVKRTSCCGVVLLCIAIDVVLIILWFQKNSPKPIKIFYQEEKSVTSGGLVETVPYNEFCSETKYPDWEITVYIFHSVQAFLLIIVAIATTGKSDDGSFTRLSASFSSLLVLGVILSDVPDRDYVSSLRNSYIIFTSVVCACTLIIIFCSFLEKRRDSSNSSTSPQNRVELTKMSSRG
ncbi:gamma-aminobutyric acid type B receptor subunit 2-like [Dendronephthya gigantea]|uniref:gamma-aminobutyric acid type B receptor subunit 2-like n=1 Tax=Dendronephthya gigantea TaxID=151771 RepID=UPI001069EED1|nr:gamma-aminobutyric acid type B receptor subunit 2-like [Dendronephthya gigantea]